MSRYEITVETTKNGRKKEVQYCLYDKLENRVVARFAERKSVQAIIDKYELIKEA